MKDGVIHHVPKIIDVQRQRRKTGCSLQTVKDYGDFELLVDWKIEKAGDSGLYLRGQPQVQIWDSDNLAASLKARLELRLRRAVEQSVAEGRRSEEHRQDAAQEGRQARRRVEHVPHHHEGRQGDDLSQRRAGRRQRSRWPNYWDKGKPLPATGPIELQHHGDKLWFKNIYIKELK